jgi:ABC-type molybdenum transport system ATPase subunit/photorepair protein PhrA
VRRMLGHLASARVQLVLATHHGEDVPGYVRHVLALGRSGLATVT